MSGGERRLALDDGSLVDVLDRLLDSGACVDGSVLITLADVDLVRLDLHLLLASVHTLERAAEHAGERQNPAEVPTEASPPKAVAAPRAEQTHTQPPKPRRPHTEQPHTEQPHTDQPHTGQVSRPSAATPPGPPAVRTAADLPGADTSTEEGDREAGVAGLVVFVVDLVRQLLERQALRRMDAGELTSTQVERLGRSLMALERQVGELTEFVAGRRRHKPDLSPFPARSDLFPDHRNPVTEGRWQR
ncbi:gas vesicle protein GvpJ [Actinopolymorpha sp. NPDC004070]|uniref:gas vesicle protein GvpJ n=1 Tax=Actinopolymorpha sp. NPDC004070 TaxID=3154548 RepID=UPI0033A37FFD